MTLWKRIFWQLIEIALKRCHLNGLKPDNEVVRQNQFRLALCHALVQPLLALRETPRVRAVRGPGRPPIPNALLVDMHMYFEQWANKRRGCKVCAYLRQARRNLKDTKTYNFFVQNVMQTFVSILVFKSGTPVQVQRRFIFLLFLVVKFSNSAIIIKNILNVFGALFAERRHSKLSWLLSIYSCL